ncbi:FAD-dependent oxidoreductase [Phytohabitans suffuscus]|uniref:FAD-dependent oxidoreductase n=1 Tax=Phytohabitans suffuscus TaxID=624315 RepID=UPI0018D8E34F
MSTQDGRSSEYRGGPRGLVPPALRGNWACHGQLVTERICLVGDAAHLPSPMTGRGFTASVQDSLALADALDGHPHRDVSAALRGYESTRLHPVRQLVHSGRSFSRSFALRGAAQ